MYGSAGLMEPGSRGAPCSTIRFARISHLANVRIGTILPEEQRSLDNHIFNADVCLVGSIQ